MNKSEFWRQWAIDGMPKDKIRLADAAWECGMQQAMDRADAAQAEAQHLREALEKIASKEHPNVGEGKCHWEGCDSPSIANQALADDLHHLIDQ